MMDDYKISDNFNGVAGSEVMSPHHSHPTNGGRPADSYMFARAVAGGFLDRIYRIDRIKKVAGEQ